MAADLLLVLLARAAGRVCALPLESVVETMRPLPTNPVAGMPPFVRGLAIIRGAPIPVVDLGVLIGTSGTESISRFVALRSHDRQIALAVEQVIGVREVAPRSLQEMPSLLREARPDLIAAVGVLDRELLVMLQVTRILPDRLWETLALHEAIA